MISEALAGVVVGGLIGWVAPLLTLRYGERRWKHEALIAHMKAERDRFEAMYEKNLRLLSEGLNEGSYHITMVSEMIVLSPKEVRDVFQAFMKPGQSADAMRGAYLELASAMNRDLKVRDAEILEMLGKAAAKPHVSAPGSSDKPLPPPL